MFQKGVGYHVWVCYNVFRKNLNQLIVYIVLYVENLVNHNIYKKEREDKIL